MEAWGQFSTIITPCFFIVLLIVLWRLLRGINGLYSVLVYTNDQIREVKDRLKEVLHEEESGVMPIEDVPAERPKKAAGAERKPAKG